jgi:hypothetical protein
MLGTYRSTLKEIFLVTTVLPIYLVLSMIVRALENLDGT